MDLHNEIWEEEEVKEEKEESKVTTWENLQAIIEMYLVVIGDVPPKVEYDHAIQIVVGHYPPSITSSLRMHLKVRTIEEEIQHQQEVPFNLKENKAKEYNKKKKQVNHHKILTQLVLHELDVKGRPILEVELIFQTQMKKLKTRTIIG